MAARVARDALLEREVEQVEDEDVRRASPGPPRVRKYTSSNSCSALIVDHTTRNSVAGPSSGSVMLRNRPHRPAPSISAASTSSRRDALQRGQVDDHVEPDPAPDRHADDRVQGAVRAVEEAERPQPHLAEHPVREAERRVEQPQEHDRGRDRRGDDRDEHRGAVEADAADPPVQRDRGEQAAGDRQRHEQHRVDHASGSTDALNSGSLRERLVVLQSRPTRAAPAGSSAGTTGAPTR